MRSLLQVVGFAKKSVPTGIYEPTSNRLLLPIVILAIAAAGFAIAPWFWLGFGQRSSPRANQGLPKHDIRVRAGIKGQRIDSVQAGILPVRIIFLIFDVEAIFYCRSPCHLPD